MVSVWVEWFQKNRIGHEEAAMIEAGTQSRLEKDGKYEVALSAGAQGNWRISSGMRPAP